MRASWVGCAVAAASLALAGGCGSSQSEELAQKLDRLQAEVSKLRAASLALEDRVQAVEARARGAAAESDPGAAPSPGDRPQLQVLRLGPSAAPVDEHADDGGEPPPPEPAEPPVVLRGDSKGAYVEAAAPATPAPRRPGAPGAKPAPKPGPAPLGSGRAGGGR
jgi:outer membrane murein-binding lipoprotein Lpp